MNVLIVGLGSIALKHVKALKSIDPEVNITALRSSRDGVIHEGIVNAYSWSEIKSDPDFILIANPTNCHKDAIREALKFKCPIFIEKPVLTSPDEADELIIKLKEAGAPTYVGCNLRFHPVILFLQDHLRQNNAGINEVNIYCGSDLASWRPGQDYKRSYSANSAMGGGVHLDLIHEIDYCCLLFGMPEDSVSIKRTVSSLGIDSFDFAAYHLNYPRFTANIVLNYYRKKPKRAIEIVTEKGTIYGDLLKCEVADDSGLIFSRDDFKMEETYSEQMKYFLAGTRKAGPMMNDFFEALEILKIAVA
jgi:predicted dehydrogenase